MKQFFYLLGIGLILYGCNSTNSSASTNDAGKEASKADTSKVQVTDQAKQTIQPQTIFTRADAEKILGEPAGIRDSSVSDSGGVWIYKSSYIANAKDKKSGKTGNIYFMAEQYENLDSARHTYDWIMKANEKNGIKILDDLGDEAYFHSDNQNFYFILARKDTRVLRMKVNKITSKTSLDEFNRIARQVVEAF